MEDTRSRSRRPRKDLDTTRRELLDAGRDELLADGTAERLEVKLIDACERVGCTTGAAYKIWGSQEEYQRDLALHVASNFQWAGPDAVTDEVDEVVATVDDHIGLIRRLLPIYFDRFVAQEDFYLALRFWAVRSPSPELADALAEGYRVVHEGFAGLYSEMLTLYGRQLRPGVTIDDFTVLVTALVEGLALRRRIDRASIDESMIALDGIATTLHAEGMIALVEWLTEPISEDQETNDQDPNKKEGEAR